MNAQLNKIKECISFEMKLTKHENRKQSSVFIPGVSAFSRENMKHELPTSVKHRSSTITENLTPPVGLCHCRLLTDSSTCTLRPALNSKRNTPVLDKIYDPRGVRCLLEIYFAMLALHDW
mgnify:CR=1 FL=1